MVTRAKHWIIAAIVATSAAGMPAAVGALSQPHTVIGTGLVNEDGVVFRTTLLAASDARGRVSGAVVLNLDLTEFDLGITNVLSRVTCVHVVGSSAWIGAEAVYSSNQDIIPNGTQTITFIRDGGRGGPDLMHGEPFDPPVSCTSEPSMPQTQILNGEYQVR